ncbi:MAG TPA: NAD(P)(+) transhydrogenase (Re/Si-specific) subunit alpha, partial [Rhizomicrobium sp.]|nr:NAD(P)(+) transhydrogenase (Re/Si-specific) subunit alpha [Rhizomicrobium sp.]
MKLAVPKETSPGETRVAATPESVKKFKSLGLQVAVQAGAGEHAQIADDDYRAAGAEIAPDERTALDGADIVLKVKGPSPSEIPLLKKGAVVAALLAPHTEKDAIRTLAGQGVSAFAMEFLPRISRAQAMDVLSSQANLAGYKAVIDAAAQFGRAMPMMMTAAGTIAPARVLVMGVGVAGLQAIATAKRLGAIVSATDVRPATKEQVESLGGTFVAVMDEEFKNAQTAGGYAKEMSKEYQAKQAALIAETIKKQDIIITTALI